MVLDFDVGVVLFLDDFGDFCPSTLFLDPAFVFCGDVPAAPLGVSPPVLLDLETSLFLVGDAGFESSLIGEAGSSVDGALGLLPLEPVLPFGPDVVLGLTSSFETDRLVVGVFPSMSPDFSCFIDALVVSDLPRTSPDFSRFIDALVVDDLPRISPDFSRLNRTPSPSNASLLPRDDRPATRFDSSPFRLPDDASRLDLGGLAEP